MTQIGRIILLTLTAIKADPSCVTRGTSVVCAPGGSDYSLKRGLVSENNQTTSITLRNCRITGVEYEAFHQLPSLKYIDMSHNVIRRLKLGVLDGFKRLEALILAHNRLTEFPLGLFDQKPNLKVLDLKGNRLEHIQLGIFDPLTRLSHLDLSSNAIVGKNLNPYIFDCSHQIQFLDFSRNDMSATPDNMLKAFQALHFLNLDRCSLTQVPSFATKLNLKTMKHLMLSNNEIRKLTNHKVFGHLVYLEKLNFVANRIEEIHEDVFKPLKSITLIFLNKNRIKRITESLFQNLQHLENLDLSDNLVEFVPVNAFRGTNLKQLNLAANRFTFLQDKFCLELRNSGAVLWQFFFEDNPWQCACLNDVFIEVKKYGVSYNADKNKGRQPVCVTNKEFKCKRQNSSNDYYMELYDNVIQRLNY